MNNQYIDTTSYTNKDFRSIWPELLELVTDLTDKWDPNNSNEADPGVALLKLKAFVADKLNYNIDKNTLEAFPSSVTQRGNAQKLYDSLGYELKWYKSAKTGLHFKFVNPTTESEITEDTGTVTFNIPVFTQVSDSENKIIYTTLESAVIDNDNNTQTEFEIDAIEGPIESFLINGSDKITINNLDADYRLYFTESMIASNGIFINNIGSIEFWEPAFNLESTNAGRKVFKFGVLPTTNQCYIQFPQDAAELFEQGINIHYVISSGSNGNIRAKFLTNFAQEYPDNGKDDLDNSYSLNKYVKVINLNGTTSGQDPETLESAYKNYQKTVNTFSTLVTLQDYYNAIYNSEKVSNVIVTDRLTDFNASYKVKNRSSVGIKDELFATNTYNGLTMNAFNLAIYPLNKVMNVYDAQTYANTFKTSSEAQRDAKTVVEDSKSVQHDWAPINSSTLSAFLFKNMVGISGQVITYQKVSTSEANQIISKIKEKIYETYQSRNIDFGKDLNVDDIIETIKNSDSRVKDFIIDDPTYFTDVMYADNSQLNLMRSYNDPVSNKVLEDLQVEIIARNILAGVTPLFLFDTDTTYSYTMKPIGSYTKVSASPAVSQIKYDEVDESLTLNSSPTADSSKPVIESYKEISAITTQVSVPLDWSKQTVRIGNNVYNITVKYDSTKDYPEVKFLNNNKPINADGTDDEDYTAINKWEWKTIPHYPENYIGTYNSKIWVCVNSGGSYKYTPSAGSSVWSQLLSYNNQLDYYANQCVISDLNVYRCKQNVSKDAGIALSNGAYWTHIQKIEGNLPSIDINIDFNDLRIRSVKDPNIESKAAGYKLKTNETLFMYAPSYISKAQMSTYLNICIKDTTNTLTSIPANSLYQLKYGQTLYVSETVFEKDNYNTNIFATNTKYLPTSNSDIEQINKQGKAYKVYEAGTIIKPSFDMINDVKGGIQNGTSDRLDNYVNLESSKTIDIMEANTTKINKKTSDSADVATKQVYCAWITDDLNNELFTLADRNAADAFIKAENEKLKKNPNYVVKKSYIEHILQQNEIFMYTDATKSDLIILQSGTRVKIPYSTTSFNAEMWKMEKPSQSEINQNGLDALESYWREIPRSLTYFEVEELEIQTLGTDVTIYNTSYNNPLFIANKAVQIEDADAIEWIYDNQTYQLPQIFVEGNAGWKAFSRLAIFSSPETVCTLGDNQSLCLFKREENYNSDLEKTEYSYSPAYVMGPGQSFTSNYVAILSGGIKQDVRVLKEDDTSEPIIISPFKYEEVSDSIGEQQLWKNIEIDKGIVSKRNADGEFENASLITKVDIMNLQPDASKDAYTGPKLEYVGGLGSISVTTASDSSCQTKLKFSGDRFVATGNKITLKAEFSGLFDGDSQDNTGTIIPLIIEGPNNIKFKFNISEISKQKDVTKEFSTQLYHDSLICLDYKDVVPEEQGKPKHFIIEILDVNKDDTILITMYPPQHYIDYNNHLADTYSQVRYYVAKKNRRNIDGTIDKTITPSGTNNISQNLSQDGDDYWFPCFDINTGDLLIKDWDATVDYKQFEAVKFKSRYYVKKTSATSLIEEPNKDDTNWKKVDIQEAKSGFDFDQFDLVYYAVDFSRLLDKVREKVIDMGSIIQVVKVPVSTNYPTGLKPIWINKFDFTYLEDDEDQILDPLNPTSFYKENHVCNKFLISQINSLDIKLARQSKQ